MKTKKDSPAELSEAMAVSTADILASPKRVFELLYSTLDTENAIKSILGFLGKTNKVSRVYIFEDTKDHKFCCNTFEWCDNGITPEIDNLAKVAYKDLGKSYLDNFDSSGIFFCPDVTVLPPKQYEILKAQGIVSMLQSSIMDGGEFKGYIGFDDCTKNVLWTEEQKQSLVMVSKIISTFLCKMRREEALRAADEKLRENLKQLKKEHKSLLESKQRFLFIMQNASVSTWEYDIKNKTIIQTESSQHQHGFSKIITNVPESLIECGYIHPDSAKAFCEMYEKMSNGEQYAEGTFLVHKSNSNGWWYEKIQYSTIPKEDGKPPMAVGISSDVTTEISDGEKMRNIVDNVPGGIGIFEIIDNNMCMQYLNNKYYELIGNPRKSREQFRGYDFWKAIYPDDIPVVKAKVKELIDGKDSVDFHYRVININGGYTWLRLNGSKIVDTYGKTLIYCNFVKIDEYMNALFELQKKQTFIDLAMNHTNMSTWEFDIKNRTVILSEEAQEQHGLSRRLENMPDKLIDGGYIHPDSVSDYRKLFSGEFPDKKTIQYDIQMKTPDRKGYWWERHFLAPIYNHNGELITAYGSGMDITEQKKLLEFYKKQVKDLENLSEEGLIAKGRYNISRNQVEYFHGNSAMAALIKTTGSYKSDLKVAVKDFADETEQKSFLELFAPENLINEFNADNNEVTFEYQRKAPDGSISWVLTKGRLQRLPISGDIILFICSYDITEKKITQKMIDTVVHLDYDYMALLDFKTKKYAVYNNNGDNTSFPPSHLLQSADYEEKIRWLSSKVFDAKDYRECVRIMSIRNVQQELSKNERFACYFNMCNRAGEIKRKMFQFSYLDKSSEKVLLTCTDITRTYKKEQAKIQELQNAYSEAEKAKEQTEEAIRVKTQFFSDMSHDLRTPLNAVIGLSELAQDEISNTEIIKSYLSSINISGKFLLNIVNDGLDLEKITSGNLHLSPKPYPYEKFKNTVCTIITPLCNAKNISFIFGQNTAPYTVLVDSVRMEQIFINLLSNAVKFTPAGGKIEFLFQNHYCENSVLHGDFIVRDNGIGMSEAFQKTMFEPFTQETNEVSSQLQGTGLGLSIVKNLVELMGGWIKVKSKPNEGTEFTIHLDMPLANSEENEQLVAAASYGESLQNKHILLVEDHPLNMQIAKKLLEKEQIKVTCAVNGKEGTEVFKASENNEFDAILMDIRMPVMNGIEATRIIRQMKREDAASVPIIAMSANAFEEDVKASLLAGMNAHLSKPIDPQKLYKTIQQFTKKI